MLILLCSSCWSCNRRHSGVKIVRGLQNAGLVNKVKNFFFGTKKKPGEAGEGGEAGGKGKDAAGGKGKDAAAGGGNAGGGGDAAAAGGGDAGGDAGAGGDADAGGNAATAELEIFRR